jgi:hypothetical protein
MGSARLPRITGKGETDIAVHWRSCQAKASAFARDRLWLATFPTPAKLAIEAQRAGGPARRRFAIFVPW